MEKDVGIDLIQQDDVAVGQNPQNPSYLVGDGCYVSLSQWLLGLECFH